MIQALLDSHHPQISIISLYTFLWCIWKSRNDERLCRKSSSPSQVYAAAAAIIKSTNLEVTTSTQITDAICFTDSREPEDVSMQAHEQSIQQAVLVPGKTIKDISNISAPIVFSDAAWSPGPDGKPAIAGLGIFIQLGGDRHCSQLCISAISPPVTSAIQAEAFSLMLASQIAGILRLQQATFLTDNAVLATAATAQNMILTPGHWSIRPQLAHIATSVAFDTSRVYHISRGYNFRAHHQAKLALKIQSFFLSVSGVYIQATVLV